MVARGLFVACSEVLVEVWMFLLCFGALLPTTPAYSRFQWTEVPSLFLSQDLAPFPSALVPGEPPPPYSPQGSPDSSSAPVIFCRVCQSSISVEGKTHQHVVKCSICNEATVSLGTSPTPNLQQWISAFDLLSRERTLKKYLLFKCLLFYPWKIFIIVLFNRKF